MAGVMMTKGVAFRAVLYAIGTVVSLIGTGFLIGVRMASILWRTCQTYIEWCGSVLQAGQDGELSSVVLNTAEC